ncbi:MAG: hypothetical protein L6Q37_17100 [Bdellovibrionaceae bacterium]|nr:hypothetical protein [Pseudobdellovibrionaceae bacterium]
MKINISLIIVDHFKTLNNKKTNKINITDIVVFYIAPFLMSFMPYFIDVKINKDIYNISITFFGIFVALLLNIQVVIFSIFQRKWEPSQDHRQAAIQVVFLESRKNLLGELNSNISYLTLFSSISLSLFFAFIIVD